MTDDNYNEGSEEENKSNQPDEDFGLPDLEFDELQELDFNLDDEVSLDSGESEENALPEPEGIDMSVLDDIEGSGDSSTGLEPGDLDPPQGSFLDEGIEEVEDVLDSAQLISDRLGEDEDPLNPDFSGINYDDLMGSESSSEETALPEFDLESTGLEEMGLDLSEGDSDSNESDDLLANIDSPDQLAALGIVEEEEETTDDSSASDDLGADLFSVDSDNADTESIFSSDSMALQMDETPEFESADDAKLPPSYKPYTYEESKGGFAKIILIIVVVTFVLGGAFYAFHDGEGTEKAIAKKEVTKKKVLKKKPTPKKVEPKVETPKKKAPTPKPTPKQAVASTAAAGEIIQVSEKTGRSYVIIGSFIDDDLAMDYAKKLSGQGLGVKILDPVSNSKRFRVSIADFDSYGDAASQLNSFKGEFGDQVWALKY